MSGKDKSCAKFDVCNEEGYLNYEHRKIAVWLKKLKFKRCLFGGVSERYVWKKIDELNRMYTSAIEAERVRYDTLLTEYRAFGIKIGFDPDRSEERGDETQQ